MTEHNDNVMLQDLSIDFNHDYEDVQSAMQLLQKPLESLLSTKLQTLNNEKHDFFIKLSQYSSKSHYDKTSDTLSNFFKYRT